MGAFTTNPASYIEKDRKAQNGTCIQAPRKRSQRSKLQQSSSFTASLQPPLPVFAPPASAQTLEICRPYAKLSAELVYRASQSEVTLTPLDLKRLAGAGNILADLRLLVR
jgi:hypothetical protein